MEPNLKYLITTDNWFYAPDGQMYKAVWGEVKILNDDFLGIKTNRNSANWFCKVSGAEEHIILAGCQIHYAVQCNKEPSINGTQSWESSAEFGVKEFELRTPIYILNQTSSQC